MFEGRTQKIILLILGTVFLVGGIWWLVATFFPSQPNIVNFPPKGSMIVALGDSLTEGVGASSYERGYIGLLKKRFDIDIVNKGVSGDTTKRGLARLDSDVLLLHPDIVIVLLGGNDFLQQVPREEVFKNLENIITRIQKNGAVVLLLGVRGGLLHDAFSADFIALAKRTGSAFVPNVLEGIIGDGKLMQDGIHPNDGGYQKIADKVAPVLEKLLKAVVPKTTP